MLLGDVGIGGSGEGIMVVGSVLVVVSGAAFNKLVRGDGCGDCIRGLRRFAHDDGSRDRW